MQNHYRRTTATVGALVTFALLTVVARCQTAPAPAPEYTEEQYRASLTRLAVAREKAHDACDALTHMEFVNHQSERYLAAMQACSDARDVWDGEKARHKPIQDWYDAMIARRNAEEAEREAERIRAEREALEKRFNDNGGPSLVRSYQALVYRAYPAFNGIRVGLSEDLSTLYASHSFFGKYSFDVGPQGPMIAQWIRRNKKALLASGITSVGVRCSEEYGGYVLLPVR